MALTLQAGNSPGCQWLEGLTNTSMYMQQAGEVAWEWGNWL